MLVGDLIVRLRELGPDPCQVIASPPVLSSASAAGGSLQASTTYFFMVTALTPWGETTPSIESSGVTSVGQGTLNVTIRVVPGASAYRVYYGLATGAETQYQSFTASFAGATQVLALTGLGVVAGFPPIRNRAYLPDTDGAFIAATTAYAWLGEALLALSKASQGVYDFTGMPSSNGQPLYQMNGIWEHVDQAWYDGWIMDLGNKSQIYYRNRIATSIAGLLVFQRIADNMIVELFPQPNRNANTTTTTGNVAATDTTIPLTLSNFVLPMGLALLSGGSQVPEIVSYAFNSNAQLTGCYRGIGGTVAQAWSTGTTVTELNIRLAGRRIITPYSVGAAASSIPVPPEWATWLPMYMLSRFRDSEGEHQLAASMRKEFMEFVNQLGKGNKQRGGPRQIGAGPQVGEVYGGTLGGGWLLP